MADNLLELEQFESEIDQYRQKFQHSSELFDELVQIQLKFEN